jgi:hypothetical protein
VSRATLLPRAELPARGRLNFMKDTITCVSVYWVTVPCRAHWGGQKVHVMCDRTTN